VELLEQGLQASRDERSLPESLEGYEDDAAVAAGVGFTDVVKRPTATAADLSADELKHELADLERKLAAVGAPLVIFAFKEAARTLLGNFSGNGFVEGLQVGSSQVFVMPGPYEKTEKAQAVLANVRDRVPSACPR